MFACHPILSDVNGGSCPICVLSRRLGLRPFWRYYGGKWRSAPRYPTPLHATIIEPFAGAAGYSLRHPDRNVILVEKYPIVAEIWRYLIATSAAEIAAIPIVDHVEDLPSRTPTGARMLVGFCLGAGVVEPKRSMSAGMRRFRDQGKMTEGWGVGMRSRAASQVDSIRHWRVIEGDYTAAPNVEATWFIDPPYEGRAGSLYVHKSDAIDYPTLGEWCRSRRGQAIVCEADGAQWLPFRSFGVTSGTCGRQSREAIWESIGAAR